MHKGFFFFFIKLMFCESISVRFVICEGLTGFEKNLNPPKFFDKIARDQLGTNLGLKLPLIF